LKEKWLGCVGSAAGLGVVLATLLAVGLVFGGVSLRALPLLLLSAAAQGAFAVGLGMYCSLACGSTFRATAVTMAGLLGVGHWLLYPFTSAAGLLLGWGEEVQGALLNFHRYGLT